MTGSLFSILNHTKTESGARRLRAWISSPSTTISEIEERQNTIRLLVGGPSESNASTSTTYQLVYEEIVGALLPKSKPLLRCVNQIHTRKISPAQLVKGLESFLHVETCLDSIYEECSTAQLETLQLGLTVSEEKPLLLLRLLQTYPRLGDQVRSCLDEISRDAAIANDTEKAILQRLRLDAGIEGRYRALCSDLLALSAEFDAVLQNCRSVLQDASLEFASFRHGIAKQVHHLIVVKRENLQLVPSDWLVVNSNKTLVRFHPREILQLQMREDFLLQMKSQLVESAWRAFVAHVDAQMYVMATEYVDKLASIDAICSLATVARTQPGYTLPRFVVSSQDHQQLLDIVGGHNAILGTTLAKASSYMSNSVVMQSDGKETNEPSKGSLLVVSGPNMGGKSSLLRMCALIVILAQIGSFVPADEVQLTMFDGVYTRMHRSSSTSFQRGKETNFTQQRDDEMDALSKISRTVTRKSFVLVDELGFGMTAHHASALAFGLMTYFVESVGCHVMFATHMASVVERLRLALGTRCQTKQFKFTLTEGSAAPAEPNSALQPQGQRKRMTFHYTITEGVASESFALDAARFAGIPEHIVSRAEPKKVPRGSDT